jgi:orotate phosphoribosyltransferase-like protein
VVISIQWLNKAKNLTILIFTKEKSDQLEWRRSKVVEMRARGMTDGEIAQELQVSRTSITSDIAYLRNRAKESIKEYIYRTLSRAI